MEKLEKIDESAKIRNERNNFAIQTFGITKKFGDLTAVYGVDLSIKKGELFALLGPNGAGKTTIIKMLCCLLSRLLDGDMRVYFRVLDTPFLLPMLLMLQEMYLWGLDSWLYRGLLNFGYFML